MKEQIEKNTEEQCKLDEAGRYFETLPEDQWYNGQFGVLAGARRDQQGRDTRWTTLRQGHQCGKTQTRM